MLLIVKLVVAGLVAPDQLSNRMVQASDEGQGTGVVLDWSELVTFGQVSV